ncbi:MAG: hypothetical protein LKF71_06520 [Oscillospiraceae bacterium]|jgi:hypothetical protein|nr:hypothetical protein [Oscillospiraceae bacterium]
MHETKGRRGFPAVLKDMSGKQLAQGAATVYAENRSIDFTGDFVPMYRMGTQLQIARIFEGKEIHLFIGTVFISDKNLLRLVSITDRLLPGSEDVYFSETKIPAVLRLVQRHKELVPKKRHFSLFHHKEVPVPETTPQIHSITVSALSGRQLEFTVNQIFDIGDQFVVTLQLADKELKELPLYISQAFAFGKGCMYRCTFDKMEADKRTELDTLVRSMNQQENSFFPDNDPASQP